MSNPPHCGSKACAATPFGRTLLVKSPLLRQERTDMTVAIDAPRHRLRPLLAAACLGAATILASSLPALARGPDGIAAVAEKVIDAVVNISTTQTVEAKGGPAEGGRG